MAHQLTGHYFLCRSGLLRMELRWMRDFIGFDIKSCDLILIMNVSVNCPRQTQTHNHYASIMRTWIANGTKTNRTHDQRKCWKEKESAFYVYVYGVIAPLCSLLLMLEMDEPESPFGEWIKLSSTNFLGLLIYYCIWFYFKHNINKATTWMYKRAAFIQRKAQCENIQKDKETKMLEK